MTKKEKALLLEAHEICYKRHKNLQGQADNEVNGLLRDALQGEADYYGDARRGLDELLANIGTTL